LIKRRERGEFGLVTTDWFNSNVRANFAKLEPNYPVQKVIGDCNPNWCYLIQLMEAPPLKSPQTFGTDMPFWGVDVASVSHSGFGLTFLRGALWLEGFVV
jgi:hypothetical protein